MRKGLAVAGTPFKSLKALMKVRAPASSAALKGGKTTLRKVCSERSVVL